MLACKYVKKTVLELGFIWVWVLELGFRQYLVWVLWVLPVEYRSEVGHLLACGAPTRCDEDQV
jgi:hypothetical protein